MNRPPSTIRLGNPYKGLWVALDRCTYDQRTAQPVEGDVVDADEDLVELCSRLRDSDSRHCAILFCGTDGELRPHTTWGSSSLAH